MDNKVTKNYIAPQTAERLEILYKKKEHPYLLITILRELVLYKNNIINLKTGPVEVNIKRRSIIVNFNILLLRTDKAVLKII